MENTFTITTPTACMSNHRSILLIDDNPHRRNALTLLLGMANFSVSSAASASEGLAMAAQGQFDLILINSQLIDHNGGELCRQIREFNKRTSILFYSSQEQQAETKAEWPLTRRQGMGILPAYV